MPTSLSTAQPTVRLGANHFGFFQGKLDEVRIYTVARNSTDILNDFTGAPPAVRPPPPIEPPPAPGPAASPVAYWKMEEGTGTTVVDSSGHGHDQHFADASAGPFWSTDAPPIVGGNAGSLAFDGGDDWTYAGGVPETAGSSQLTVEAWVKPSALTGAVIQAWDSGLAMQWYLSLSGGELVVQVADPARGNPWGMTVGANLQPGIWYHVAFVFDGAGATNADKWRMYVNGEAFPVAFSGDVPTSLSTAQPTVRLGANNFGFFQGKLDEVSIYTVARNSTDIANDAQGQPQDTTPPTANATQAPSANSATWNNSDVTVTWNWTDSGSGLDPSNCTTSSISSGEGVLTLTATCKDLAGRVGSASYPVKVDKTPPVLTAVPADVTVQATPGMALP